MTDDARRSEEAFSQEEANLLKVVASPSRHQQHSVMISKFTAPKQTESSNSKQDSMLISTSIASDKGDPSIIHSYSTESSGKSLPSFGEWRADPSFADGYDYIKNKINPSSDASIGLRRAYSSFAAGNPSSDKLYYDSKGRGREDSSLADGYTHITSNQKKTSDKVASVPDLIEWSKNDPSLVRCFTESSGKPNQHRLNREQHEIQGGADSTRNNPPTKTTENRISIGPHQFRDDNPQVLQHKPEKCAPFPEFGDLSTHHLQADGYNGVFNAVKSDCSLADGYTHMTKPEEMLPEATNTNQSKDHHSLNSNTLKGCGCFPWG